MKNEIANRLRISRENMGYTQESVAEHLGISSKKVSSFEIGRTKVDLETLKHLCELYKIDANYVLGVNRPEDGVAELLDILSQRPELATLLKTAVNSTKEGVEVIINITKILQR